MKHLIYLILLISSLWSDSNGNTLKSVKIELNQLSEIGKLVNQGITANGYVIEDKYWITSLSDEAISRLDASGYQYTLLENDDSEKLEKNVSYLFGNIMTNFNNCGYQLSVSYNQSEKLSFMSIQIFDMSDKSLGKRIGYNIPASNYECKFSSHNWPNGIYLVRIKAINKESIYKIFQKGPLTKKV